MNKLIVFIAAIGVVSGAVAQRQYQQKEYVFTMPEGSLIEADAQQECTQALDTIDKLYAIRGINPGVSAKLRLSTLETREGSGRVTRNDVGAIGEILVCLDWETYWAAGKNLVPAYFEITIGGKKYRVQGAGISPHFPDLETLPGGGSVLTEIGYPKPGVAPLHFSGTVLPSREGKPGGMFSMGMWNPFNGVDRPNIDHYAIGVLQVMLPMRLDVTRDGRSVFVDGNEWLQPADFVAWSYNQISDVCPDGVCSGSLRGSTIDLTGYLWATSEDVSMLFRAYSGAGRDLTTDFDDTTDNEFIRLAAMVSDPPRERHPFPENPNYTEIDLVVALGGEITYFPGDPDEVSDIGLGVWFWRPSD